MEVGNQPVYRLELVAGRDEDRGVTLERVYGAILVRGTFEQP